MNVSNGMTTTADALPHNATPDHLRDKTSKIGVSGWVGADAEVSDFPSMFTLYFITSHHGTGPCHDRCRLQMHHLTIITHYLCIIQLTININYLILTLRSSCLKN